MTSWSEANLYRIHKEVSGILKESTHVLDSNGKDERWLITEQIDCVTYLLEIDTLTRNIIRSKSILFSLKENSRTKQACATKLGQKFLDCLNLDIARVRHHYPKHEFSPYFNLYEEHIADKGLTTIAFNESTVDAFNACVSRIRAGAKSKGFAKALDHCKRSSRKNYAGLVKYIRGLHDHHSKLLVIRLDLGYQKQFCGSLEHDDPLSYSEAKQHRKSFIKYLKKNYSTDCLVGYVWKLEYGKIKSYHYHVLLLFNGQRVREDITIARLLGEHWKNIITQGMGLYFNCNAKKFTYRNRGIGMISHNDATLRKNLEDAVLDYLVKAECYIKFSIPNGRAFGKGGLPKKSPSRLGRPRKAV